MSLYELRKSVERGLPDFLYQPLRQAWRASRENPETKIVRLLCRPDEASVDVGACEGDMAITLAQFSEKCFVFEANPGMIPRLTDRMANANADIFNYALSNDDGETQLTVPVSPDGELTGLGTIEPENADQYENAKTYCVPMRRLDSFEFPKLACIKIDVEGHEQTVLEGAEKLLERDEPGFLIEAEERHKAGSVAAVADFFRTHGYEGFFLKGREICPITLFDASIHQNADNIVEAQIKPGGIYHNMFVFAKAADQLKALKSG